MASNSFAPEIPVFHPLVEDSCVRPNNIRDSLTNCAATIHLLTELFVSESDDYSTFDSVEVRRGISLQLQTVANTLEAIESCLRQEAEISRAEREAEREAEQEARRATKERIEADPAVIEKTTILAKAFAQAYRELSDKDGKEGAA